MVFQIRDDCLDVTATDEELGKPAGQDLVEGTYSLPVIRALALPGVGDELRPLLGHPLDPLEMDKARAVIRDSDAVESALAHRPRARRPCRRRLGSPRRVPGRAGPRPGRSHPAGCLTPLSHTSALHSDHPCTKALGGGGNGAVRAAGSGGVPLGGVGVDGVRARRVARPARAAVARRTSSSASAFAFTAACTYLWRRDPQTLLHPAMVVTELALGGALLVFDGLVRAPGTVFATGQSLGSVWPLTGVISAGVALGPWGGGIAGVLMGGCRYLSTALNDVDGLRTRPRR